MTNEIKNLIYFYFLSYFRLNTKLLSIIGD